MMHLTSLVNVEIWWLVKSRSTCWFLKFVLIEYDDKRWLMNLRIIKVALMQITVLLGPHIQKQDTNFYEHCSAYVRQSGLHAI